MPVIQDLGADHDDLLARAAHVHSLIETGDRPAARDEVDRLVAALRIHTAVEEASLFAGLRSAGEMLDHIDALTTEHTHVWDAVAGLARLPHEAWDGAVLVLLDELHEHIAREEYDLFPATLMAISPAAWDGIETAAAEVRAAAAN